MKLCRSLIFWVVLYWPQAQAAPLEINQDTIDDFAWELQQVHARYDVCEDTLQALEANHESLEIELQQCHRSPLLQALGPPATEKICPKTDLEQYLRHTSRQFDQLRSTIENRDQIHREFREQATQQRDQLLQDSAHIQSEVQNLHQEQGRITAIHDLSTEHHQLTAQVQVLQKKETRLQTQVETLFDKTTDQTASLLALEIELAQTQGQLVLSHKKAVTLILQLELLQRKQNAAEFSITSLVAELEEGNIQTLDSLLELQAEQTKRLQMEQNLAQSQQQFNQILAKLSKQNKNLETEIKNRNQQIQVQDTQTEILRQHLNKNHKWLLSVQQERDLLSQQLQQIQTSQQNVEQFDAMLTAREQIIFRLQEDNDRLRGEEVALSHQKDQKHRALTNSRQNILQKEQQIKHLTAKSIQQAATLETQKKAQNRMKIASKEAKIQLLVTLETVQHEREDLQAALDWSQLGQNQCQTALQQLRQAQNKLEGASAEQQQKMAALVGTLDTLHKRLAQNTDHRNQLQKEITQGHQKAEALAKALAQTKQQLLTQNAEKAEEIIALQAQQKAKLIATKEVGKQLQNQLDYCQQKQEKLAQEINHAQADLATQKQQADKAQADSKRLQQQALEKFRREQEKRQQKLAEVKAEQQTMRLHIQQLVSSNNKLESKQTKETSLLEQLQQQIVEQAAQFRSQKQRLLARLPIEEGGNAKPQMALEEARLAGQEYKKRHHSYRLAPKSKEAKTLMQQAAQALQASQQWLARLSHARGTYTIRSEDTLGTIAQHMYGSPRHWRHIYLANQHILKNPDQIMPGMMLVIP